MNATLTAAAIEALRRQLYTPVIADVLDQLGLRNQVLRPFVRPLDDTSVLFGPARTGMYMPVEVDAMEHDPYGVEIALIDDLLPGEVVVLGCNGPTERIVPWGELLTTAAQQRGAAGCITDGLVRDVRQIRAMRFALFHGGISPLDSRGRGRMMTRDRPIVCGGVTIQPGDYIFGDVDGVVVIPRAALDETLQRSLAKVSGENQVRDALLGGMSLTDAFAKYGLL